MLSYASYNLYSKLETVLYRVLRYLPKVFSKWKPNNFALSTCFNDFSLRQRQLVILIFFTAYIGCVIVKNCAILTKKIYNFFLTWFWHR